MFPSPCGVWVVSSTFEAWLFFDNRFRPLAGCGLFLLRVASLPSSPGFRPLAGCGLFPDHHVRYTRIKVSVPLRGVGCFRMGRRCCATLECFRPLAGCGLFPSEIIPPCTLIVFPSPCGVWVVSAKLHILSGATGKRIVNSAILLYHIGRCLSIAN